MGACRRGWGSKGQAGVLFGAAPRNRDASSQRLPQILDGGSPGSTPAPPTPKSRQRKANSRVDPQVLWDAPDSPPLSVVPMNNLAPGAPRFSCVVKLVL